MWYENKRSFWMGFTLIELLIVVAIIAILAAIAVPNFMEAQMRAKAVSVRADMKNIVNAQEMYRADNGDYVPDSGTDWDSDFESLFALSTPVAYIVKIPTNPFFDKSNVGNKARGNFSYWRDYGGDWGYDEPRYNVMWSITSVGPDGKMTLTPLAKNIRERQPDFVNNLYNPTNGTKSGGDLHACNLGVSD